MELDDYNAALAAQNAGRFAEAERGYRAILAQVIHLPSLHNLGVLLWDTAHYDEAGAVYLEAARLAPDALKPQLALANHYRV